MKNRSSSEIIYDILKAGEKRWTTKTHLMFASYISTNQVREYLGDLIDKDLLLYNSDRKLYRTSNKGLKFLELNDELVEKFGYGPKPHNSKNSDY